MPDLQRLNAHEITLTQLKDFKACDDGVAWFKENGFQGKSLTHILDSIDLHNSDSCDYAWWLCARTLSASDLERLSRRRFAPAESVHGMDDLKNLFGPQPKYSLDRVHDYNWYLSDLPYKNAKAVFNLVKKFLSAY